MPDGFDERRIRVTCQLPCGDADQAKAVREVFRYLKQQIGAAVPVSGFSHTTLRPPIFTGWWFGSEGDDSDEKRRWIPDNNVLLIIDYETPRDENKIDGVAGRLHDALVTAYRKYGSEQKVFWITSEKISRLV